MRELFYAAAKATTEVDYRKNVKEIKPLPKVPACTWSIFQCDRSRLGHTTSNIVESFNSAIVEARKAPNCIVLLIQIANLIAKWYSDNKQIYFNLYTNFCSSLLNEARIGAQLVEHSVTNDKKNEHHFADGSVVLNGVCSCKFSKEFHMGCKHLLKITNRAWFDNRYTSDNYQKMYSRDNIVVRSETLAFAEPEAVHPFSSSKRMPGRPKTARIQSSFEKAMKKATKRAEKEKKQQLKVHEEKKEVRKTEKVPHMSVMETRASKKKKEIEKKRKLCERNASGGKRKRGRAKGEGNPRKKVRIE